MSQTLDSIDVVTGHSRANRADLGRMRVSVAAFPAAYEIPSHYHDRACISVVMAGLFKERFPGRLVECGQGSVLTKPPGERHVDRWGNGEARHVIIEPDPTRHEELGSGRWAAETVSFAEDAVCHGIARRIAHELCHPDEVTQLALEALALELLVRLTRVGTGRTESSLRPPWLNRVRDRIHDCAGETLSLDELAGSAGVHPSHLSRTFSAHFGVGVGEYQRRVRLARTRRELEETDLPLSVIAFRNGFSDQSHMTRQLRNATGLTPARYRAVYGS